MKRRVLIAKALSHEPGGALSGRTDRRRGRRTAQRHVGDRCGGSKGGAATTIILTTHYIEEAEAIADRVGVISAKVQAAVG